MLDGDKLEKGNISIIGVFTTYRREQGMAFGERSDKIIRLLDVM